MRHFVITDFISDISSGRYTNLDAAHYAAIRYARANGATELLSIYTSKTLIQVCSPDRKPIVTAHLNGPPAIKPIRGQVTKMYKFSGRPSVSGWYKSPIRTELNLENTLKLIKKPGEYYLVYMDILGEPLSAVIIDGVDAEVTALLRRQGKGGIVRPASVACDMALAVFDAPKYAVAVFVVSGPKEGPLQVAGKRVTLGLKSKPYERTPMPAVQDKQVADDLLAAMAQAYK